MATRYAEQGGQGAITVFLIQLHSLRAKYFRIHIDEGFLLHLFIMFLLIYRFLINRWLPVMQSRGAGGNNSISCPALQFTSKIF
jgi:hypothetical protein